jgi:GNAT superfamily N-acetyltransferase
MSEADLVLRVVEDKTELCRLLVSVWGSHTMMLDLRTYDVAEIDALGLYDEQGEAAALASWTMNGDHALLCALIAVNPGSQAGTILLDAVKDAARARGATRLKAMVTNDNMPALVFYQKRGFRFSALYAEAIEAYRSVIPTIIRTGYEGIPVRDALELEIDL